METLGATAAHDLDELESFGFALERHPYQGVAYRGPSARLCPDQIEYELGTQRIGRRIAVWNRVTSTNDLAARTAVSRANEGLVILAESQTAGRGSRGRRWTAPAGTSLLMSVLLFPPEPLTDPAWLTALGAVAVAEIVDEWSGANALIKWPNDVRVDGKKIAGILVERSAGAVLGIGVNANVDASALPPEVRDGATSLHALRGTTVDRSELVRALIQRLDALYDHSLRAGASVLSAPWRQRSEHLGAAVVVTTPSGPIAGRLDDLDLCRGLALTGPDGGKIHVPARQILSIQPGSAAGS